ncbi:MAG: NUDIX hydrolase [Erysipelotrichaceae bacterium]
MRLLFNIGNFEIKDTVYQRDSYRAIIIKNNKVAMVHSLKYDYYKFPGGGMELNETYIDTLTRETREEAGLIIKPESIEEYGLVHRIDKLKEGGTFIQDNYYYLCDIEEERISQKLDEYEDDEGFTLEFVEASKAISINRNADHGPKSKDMIEREARVLELLIKEGYLC